MKIQSTNLASASSEILGGRLDGGQIHFFTAIFANLITNARLTLERFPTADEHRDCYAAAIALTVDMMSAVVEASPKSIAQLERLLTEEKT